MYMYIWEVDNDKIEIIQVCHAIGLLVCRPSLFSIKYPSMKQKIHFKFTGIYRINIWIELLVVDMYNIIDIFKS
jgi:hypothetical protein